MLSIPIGGGLMVSSSPVDDLLSKGLSDAVGCMFSSAIPIPFANLRIESVSQESQPVPARWPEEVAIDDEGVFGPGGRSGMTSESSSASQSATASAVNPMVMTAATNGVAWSGQVFFDQSVIRLSLDKSLLNRLIEKDEEVVRKYGSDIADLSKVKKIIKNELKDYDTAFKADNGRDPARSDKEPMRLLYTLYRKLRDMIGRLEANQPLLPAPTVVVSGSGQSKSDLEQRLDVLYDEKQHVRQVLQEYQARFMTEQGRRIKYHRDIVAVDREYRQYKQVKEEIAKIETQLGRQQTSHRNSNDFF